MGRPPPHLQSRMVRQELNNEHCPGCDALGAVRGLHGCGGRARAGRRVLLLFTRAPVEGRGWLLELGLLHARAAPAASVAVRAALCLGGHGGLAARRWGSCFLGLGREDKWGSDD